MSERREATLRNKTSDDTRLSFSLKSENEIRDLQSTSRTRGARLSGTSKKVGCRLDPDTSCYARLFWDSFTAILLASGDEPAKESVGTGAP